MWQHSSVTSVGLIFYGARAVFGMDACHVFPHGILALVPLIRSVFAIVVTTACAACLTGPPLCSVVVTALLESGSAS